MMHPLLLVVSCFLLLPQMGSTFDPKSSCQLQNYTVSPVGNDSKECVTSDHNRRLPCQTFSYLLQWIRSKSCVNVTILDDQDLTEGPIKLQSIQNWTIVGSNSESAIISIHCRNDSGISFENFSSIHLHNLQFVNCSTLNNHMSDDTHLLEYSALYFFQGSDVVISGCLFCNGSGTAVIMNDVAGENLIKDTHFIGNRVLETSQRNVSSTNSTSGGLIVRNQLTSEPASYTIDGCNFVDNGNYQCYFNGNYLIGLGGGATFNVSIKTNITVLDSNFTSNRACQGGGINVYQQGSPEIVNVSIIRSYFSDNHVIHTGGGLCVQQSEASLSLLNLTLQHCVFFNNSGKFGGGIDAFNTVGNIQITAEDSTWSRNSALKSGFGVGLNALTISAERPNNKSSFHIRAAFSRCKFFSNTNNGNYGSKSQSDGTVMVDAARADFTDVDFIDNTGTALSVQYYSYVHFEGRITFRGNGGSMVGALYISQSSMVYIRNLSLLNFEDNYATNHATTSGGAIYVEYTEKDDECVFESLKTLLNSSDTNIIINFSNNTASGQNRSIFIGNANSCIQKRPESMQNIIFFDSKIFKFSPNETSQVASFAETIQVNYSPGAKDVINVMPGENFYLNLTVKDAFGNDAYQFGNIALKVQDKERIPEVQYVGPQYLGFDNSTVNNALVIKANKSLIGYHGLFLELLYTKDSSNHEKNLSIQVNLTECKPGFAFEDQMQICQCTESDVNLVCNNSYACVQYGYWYSDDLNMTIPCPEHNCDYHNGRCPNNNMCSDTRGFCLLAANTSICKTGRNGFLCSKCLDDYAYNFAGMKCVHNSSCTAKNTTFIMLGLVAYWIFLVVFVLFILSVRLSIGSGIAYGIMYYFSVMPIFTIYNHEPFLHIVITISISITQISPEAFDYIPICFVENWRLGLHHYTFYYVTPAAVIFMIALVVLWSRYCPCPKSISPAHNTPIHAICLLVLASYTSVTHTNVILLEPTFIGRELRVFADPELHYFHKEHLPYALVALFFEFSISLPICFLILFAPCLSRRVNMVKLRLKPILDEFQACYRPECRWFAGFYFLARQVIFVVSIIPTRSSNTYIHSINVVILIIHCSYQPYKQKWLNVLDTLLLANLTFLSFIQLGYNSDIPNKIAVYILILPPALYLVIIVGFASIHRLYYSCFKQLMCVQRVKSNQENEIPSALSSHNPVSINGPQFEGSAFFRDDGEREPLLAVHSGQIPYPHNRNSGGARPFTTASVRISRINRSHTQTRHPPEL